MIVVLRCTVGGRDVAVRVEAVREVVRGLKPVAPLFAAAPIVGLLNVRGRVVPLLEWADGVDGARDQVLIVEDSSGAWLGVGIDASGGFAQASVSSDEETAVVDGESLPLLDPDRLVPVAGQ